MFIANRPENDGTNYFAQTKDDYRFFLHLWSLSTEIQFYLFVPCLAMLLGLFNFSLKILVVLLIASISFWHQINSTHDEEHMALSSRVWQFMVGYLAYYLSEVYLMCSKMCSNAFKERSKLIKKQCCETYCYVIL
ncbi:hypothetical protein M3Y97_00964300 [Aphelenchoides bicaudatus]|nr:hypothetical protein M3Y97_00964300 [Aphelenchoides bicaudatus]